MSEFSAIVDAWVTELVANVSGLSTAIQHKYAPWSPEQLFAQAGERHLAVWPESEPEAVEGLTVTGDDLATQLYVVLVWEEAAATDGRLQEDDTADLAWLTLAEAIRARFYLSANRALGSNQIMDTRYRGLSFGRPGDMRSMQLVFRVRIPHLYT